MLPSAPPDPPRLRRVNGRRLRRALLPLVLLALVGCSSVGYQEYQAQFTALQNPRYRGDANRDLVPYQARNRDAAECGRADEVKAQMAAVEVDLSRYPTPTMSALLADPAQWRAQLAPFFACMTARGWRATP